MRALVDINVLLDTLLLRQPHEPAATRFLAEVEHGRVSASLCAASIDTVYYLLRRQLGRRRAIELIRTIRRLLGIVPVDARVVDAVIALGWNDLEDAIIHESARLSGINVIVTRGARDFRQGNLTVIDPGEALVMVPRTRE